jgi:hypothetical protein
MQVSSKLAHRAMTSVCAAMLGTSLSTQGLPPPSASPVTEPVLLVFVVNRHNPVESLSLATARMLLLGEQSHWPDGDRITVVMRAPKQPERDAVLRLVCRLEDRDYTRTVLRAVFTGELRSAPKLLDSAAGVLRFIYNVPGAIGYIQASEFDDSVKLMPLSDPPAGAAAGFTMRAR